MSPIFFAVLAFVFGAVAPGFIIASRLNSLKEQNAAGKHCLRQLSESASGIENSIFLRMLRRLPGFRTFVVNEPQLAYDKTTTFELTYWTSFGRYMSVLENYEDTVNAVKSAQLKLVHYKMNLLESLISQFFLNDVKCACDLDQLEIPLLTKLELFPLYLISFLFGTTICWSLYMVTNHERNVNKCETHKVFRDNVDEATEIYLLESGKETQNENEETFINNGEMIVNLETLDEIEIEKEEIFKNDSDVIIKKVILDPFKETKEDISKTKSDGIIKVDSLETWNETEGAKAQNEKWSSPSMLTYDLNSELQASKDTINKAMVNADHLTTGNTQDIATLEKTPSYYELKIESLTRDLREYKELLEEQTRQKQQLHEQSIGLKAEIDLLNVELSKKDQQLPIMEDQEVQTDGPVIMHSTMDAYSQYSINKDKQSLENLAIEETITNHHNDRTFPSSEEEEEEQADNNDKAYDGDCPNSNPYNDNNDMSNNNKEIIPHYLYFEYDEEDDDYYNYEDYDCGDEYPDFNYDEEYPHFHYILEEERKTKLNELESDSEVDVWMDRFWDFTQKSKVLNIKTVYKRKIHIENDPEFAPFIEMFSSDKLKKELAYSTTLELMLKWQYKLVDWMHQMDLFRLLDLTAGTDKLSKSDWALMLVRTKDFTKAEDVATRLYNESHSGEIKSIALYILGHSHLEQTCLEEAVSYFKKAIQVDPTNEIAVKALIKAQTKLFLEMGRLSLRRKAYRKAERLFSEAIQIGCPTLNDNITLYYCRAMTRALLSRYEESIDDCEKAIEKEENRGQDPFMPYCVKVFCLVKLRRYTEARDFCMAPKSFDDRNLEDYLRHWSDHCDAILNHKDEEGPTYYDVLGVDRECSQEDIVNAFRRMAKLYHPDKHPDVDEHQKSTYVDQFKKVNMAYEVLGEEYERSHYNHKHPDITYLLNNLELGIEGAMWSVDDEENVYGVENRLNLWRYHVREEDYYEFKWDMKKKYERELIARLGEEEDEKEEGIKDRRICLWIKRD